MAKRKRAVRKSPAEKATCLHCDGESHSRGLCIKCYFTFVRDRQTTGRPDEEYVARGLVAPSKRGGASRFREVLRDAFDTPPKTKRSGK